MSQLYKHPLLLEKLENNDQFWDAVAQYGEWNHTELQRIIFPIIDGLIQQAVDNNEIRWLKHYPDGLQN